MNYRLSNEHGKFFITSLAAEYSVEQTLFSSASTYARLTCRSFPGRSLLLHRSTRTTSKTTLKSKRCTSQPC